jgi:branched-subunit amino acid transport protein
VTEVWITIGALAVTTAAIRAFGPVLVGGRELPPRAMNVIALTAASLLAALVVVETFGGARSLELDARAAGLAGAAAVLAVRRDAILPAVTAAAFTAAVVRALFGS